MAECYACGNKSPLISSNIGLCRDCVIQSDITVLKDIHLRLRKERGLSTGQGGNEPICSLCINDCSPLVGSNSFCGLKKRTDNGNVEFLADREHAILHAYKDRLPTNCCSSWFCSRGTNPPRNSYNLAIFFYSCSFHCLFCQNHSHWNTSSIKPTNIDTIVDWIKSDTSIACVCYFGGTPEPHFPFVLELSKRITDEVNREIQICFEWNGSGKQNLVMKAARYSIVSGGNIKFDLKAWNEKTHLALTGQSNKLVLANFSAVTELVRNYSGDHLTASTLLVPQYVNSMEVAGIAGFISEHGKGIPYSLLIFHPDYLMDDLPITPMNQVEKCMIVAKKLLERVNLGNAGLLSLSRSFK